MPHGAEKKDAIATGSISSTAPRPSFAEAVLHQPSHPVEMSKPSAASSDSVEAHPMSPKLSSSLPTKTVDEIWTEVKKTKRNRKKAKVLLW